MSKARRTERETPACFATVPSGLEAVAADEITRDLGGEVKKAEQGIVVFRVPEIGPDLLRLRTVDDVFLLAWGTDSLTYRAEDLKSIRQWTAKEADWQHCSACTTRSGRSRRASRAIAWSPRWAAPTATGGSTPARPWPRASAA